MRPLLTLTSLLLVFLAITSCQNDDPVVIETMRMQLIYEAELSPFLEGEESGNQLPELRMAADTGGVYAEINLLEYEANGNFIASHSFKKVPLGFAANDEGTNGRLVITDTITLNAERNRIFKLDMFALFDNADREQPLYCSVKEGSNTAKQLARMPKGSVIQCNGAFLNVSSTLYKERVLLQHAKYKKAEEFGYGTWVNNMLVTYSVPFVVHLCAYPGFEDYMGSGIMEIYRLRNYQGTSRPHTFSLADWDKVYECNYGRYQQPEGEATYGRFLFADDLSIPNDREWYYIRLINKEFPMEAYYIETVSENPNKKTNITVDNWKDYRGISMKELISYINPTKGWDRYYQILEIGFCNEYHTSNAGTNIFGWGNWWQSTISATEKQ